MQYNVGHQNPTDFRRVVNCTEYQLGRTIVARANVRHIRFAGQQLLGTAKVAQLQDCSLWVQQQILWLNVSVTDAHLVDIR